MIFLGIKLSSSLLIDFNPKACFRFRQGFVGVFNFFCPCAKKGCGRPPTNNDEHDPGNNANNLYSEINSRDIVNNLRRHRSEVNSRPNPMANGNLRLSSNTRSMVNPSTRINGANHSGLSLESCHNIRKSKTSSTTVSTESFAMAPVPSVALLAASPGKNYEEIMEEVDHIGSARLSDEDEEQTFL